VQGPRFNSQHSKKEKKKEKENKRKKEKNTKAQVWQPLD
jgi:hypothetical protein